MALYVPLDCFASLAMTGVNEIEVICLYRPAFFVAVRCASSAAGSAMSSALGAA